MIKMRFQVLMVANMKIRAFWDVVPRSLGVDKRFRCEMNDHPNDGRSTHLWNVSLLRDYTALHPRRL
jgi:hypothetical protein